MGCPSFPFRVARFLLAKMKQTNIRHTQILLPMALKVAKSDFEPRIDEQLVQ